MKHTVKKNMIKILFGIILLTGMAIPELGAQNDSKNIEHLIHPLY
ncbi:MAG: hypothetical protein QM534_14455 [Sediminibacterium sp.]|nr:hypothetical protein [Sediminibacterium sp.]